MAHVLFLYLLPCILVGWCILGSVRYPLLKRRVLSGERSALLREYQMTIVGEIVMAVLAVIAVGGNIMRPLHGQLLTIGSGAAVAKGFVIGIVLLVCGLMVATMLAAQNVRASGVQPPVLGDISVILPRSRVERQWFAGVAVCAGVCEELLFRGYLFHFLGQWHLSVLEILVLGAVIFGCAHFYQGWKGILGTGVLGAILGFVFVASGTLIIPMILHALLDLRATCIPLAPLGEEVSVHGVHMDGEVEISRLSQH